MMVTGVNCILLLHVTTFTNSILSKNSQLLVLNIPVVVLCCLTEIGQKWTENEESLFKLQLNGIIPAILQVYNRHSVTLFTPHQR